MTDRNDSPNIKEDSVGKLDNEQSSASPNRSKEKLFEDESTTLMSDPSMPEVVNTVVSSPSVNNEKSQKVSKQSSCYKFRHGARVATRKVGSGCNSYWSSACSVNNLKKKLPIITWLPNYRLNTFKCDVIAGLTVGLTVIPQGMAYAGLAGLEVQYGLYSAIMGSFIYCLMGTSRDISMGPTAIMSILTSEYAHDPWRHDEDSEETTNVQLAIMLTLMCGFIQILMTVFRLGFLVRYISHPVITGFTSAASIVIATTQLKKIFGLHTPRGFFLTIYHLFKDIAHTKVWDLTLGVICMIILYFLKFAKERWSKPKDEDKTYIKLLRKVLWFAATARNAIVVILSASIAYGIHEIDLPPQNRSLTLTKNVTGGVPPFELPSFSYDVPGENRTVYFGEMLSQLGSGLLVVPLIGFLEAIAIAKAFGRKNNYKVDASQELLAIGTCNFLSSFVSSFPITASFGRSAVNAQSNVMTPLGGIITGSIVLLSLQFLSDAFQFIPQAALAAVIIMAIINLFDLNAMIHIFKVNKMDMVPLLATFFLCFWDIAYGIMIGIGVSILILLMDHARPKVKASHTGDIVTITIKRGLDFPGAEYIEEKLQLQAEKGECKMVIVDCNNLTALDYSAAEAFFHGAEALKRVNISLRLCGLTVGQERKLKNVGIVKHDVKFYDDVEEALQDSLPNNHHVDSLPNNHHVDSLPHSEQV